MPSAFAVETELDPTRQDESLLRNDYRSAYRRKFVSAEQALRVVKSGDRVVLGHACGEPPVLVEALVARAPELRDVEVVHMVAMGPAAFAQPGMERSFRFNGFFLGAPTRKAVQENRGTYTPCFFSEVPRLFKRGILPVDVMLLQVTPPDEQGFCSYGLSGDYTQAATESARVVIAQMNANLPHTAGIKIHVDALTWIVRHDSPIVELAPPRLTKLNGRSARTLPRSFPTAPRFNLA